MELLVQSKSIKEAVKRIHGKRSETEKIDYYSNIARLALLTKPNFIVYQVEKEFFGSEMGCGCKIF